MNVSIHLNGIFYLSSKEAGRLSGYTSDYVTKLAREKKVVATRVGAQWFVEPKSLDRFLQFAEKAKLERKNILRQERLGERKKVHTEETSVVPTHVDFWVSKNGDIEHTAVAHYTTSAAHRTAFLAITSGLALACLFVLLPSTPTPTLATASLFTSGSHISQMFEHFSLSSLQSFFTFGTTDEVAVKEIQDHPSVHTPSRGIVVMPLSTSRSTMSALKDSFSDNVDVAVDADGASGTITPVFKDGKGSTFRFLMVPVRSP